MNDGRKKKPQKHKNRTAFKITFDTQALEQQKKVSLNKYYFSYKKSLCQMHINHVMEIAIQQVQKDDISREM